MTRNDFSTLEFMCVDPLKVGRFWSALLEIPLEEGASGDRAQLDAPDPQPRWSFVKSETHGNSDGFVIALTSYHLDEDAARAVALGATSSKRHTEADHDWIEMRDPEGHRFTFNAPTPH